MIFLQLDYVKLRIEYQTVSDVVLTNYKGATLASLFKTALRNICCNTEREQCKPGRRHSKASDDLFCPEINSCAYGLATQHVSDTKEDTVLPHVISCSGIKHNYMPQKTGFSFEIFLFGMLADDIEKIIASLIAWEFDDISHLKAYYSSREIEKLGIPDKWPKANRPCGVVSLKKVEQIMGNKAIPLYQMDTFIKRPVSQTIQLTASAPDNENMEKVILQFSSPTILKKKKKFIKNNDVEFKTVFYALRRRLESLAYYFGSINKTFAEQEFSHCQSLIAKVSTAANFLEHEKITTSKTNRHNEDTFIGEIVFNNVPSCFHQWIKAGELIHIGKSTTQGFGEFNACFF